MPEERTPDEGRAERHERALRLLDRLEPGAARRVPASLGEISDDLAESVLGFAFADVVSRPAIDLKTREMLTVAALTAMGTAPGSSSSTSAPPARWGSAARRSSRSSCRWPSTPACPPA